MPVTKELMTTKEAASLLNIHVESFRRIVRGGRIPFRRIGNMIFVEKKTLEEFAKTYSNRRGPK